MIPPQMNNMSTNHKVVYGSECCISIRMMHSYLLTRRDNWLKNLKNRVTTCTLEGLVKLQAIFLEYIRIRWCHMIVISTKKHHTWPWEIFSFSIWSTRAASLEMCVMLLWQMSKYFHTRWIIEQGWSKQVSKNIFSCVQSLINMYYEWKTVIRIKNSLCWKVT